MQLKLLQIREAHGHAITTSKEIAKMMKEEAQADRECFWVLHLNTQNKIIEKELVAIGTLDAAYISPREVFKKAIINSASSIITIHNHPGGEAKPSKDDMRIWNKLADAGEILGINVLDNLIITPQGKYYNERSES